MSTALQFRSLRAGVGRTTLAASIAQCLTRNYIVDLRTHQPDDVTAMGFDLDVLGPKCQPDYFIDERPGPLLHGAIDILIIRPDWFNLRELVDETPDIVIANDLTKGSPFTMTDVRHDADCLWHPHSLELARGSNAGLLGARIPPVITELTEALLAAVERVEREREALSASQDQPDHGRVTRLLGLRN